MARWTKAYKDRLPDEYFFYVAPGGTFDGRRTRPLSLRHLPYRDHRGGLSTTHLRSVLSGYGSRAQIPAKAKAKAQAIARDILEGLRRAHANEPLTKPQLALLAANSVEVTQFGHEPKRRARHPAPDAELVGGGPGPVDGERPEHVGRGAKKRAHPRGGHTEVQSILFAKTRFPRKADVVRWLKANSKRHDSIEDSGWKTGNGRFWRARQHEPRKGVRTRIIDFGDFERSGIKAVIEAHGSHVPTALGQMEFIGRGEPPPKGAKLLVVGPRTRATASEKVTIYAAYTSSGRFCCWHHERAIASQSAAKSGGFVKRYQVTAFDWPRQGPLASEVPRHATPPSGGGAPGK